METMEITEVAEATEALIHKVLTATITNPFELPGARIYGVENGEVFILAQHPDIYSLLDDDSVRDEAKAYEYSAVVTAGWAAPLNADGSVDGAPSAHPERRRVRLVVVANADGVASVLRFSDDAENVVVDAGEATGSLANAIRDFVAD
jgi:hypothetical protein